MGWFLKLSLDPCFDVAASVAEVAAHPEPRWALAAVTPGVNGGDGNTEVVGYFLGAEEPLERRARGSGISGFHRVSKYI